MSTIRKKATKKSDKPVGKPNSSTKKGKTIEKVSTTKLTTYVPVSHHIYYDGYSYRVRVVVDGVKHSQSFPSKRKAFTYRRSIMSGQ
jgi:ribosomal protein S12